MLNPIETDILRTLFRSSSSLEFATLFFRIKRPSTALAKAILSLKDKGLIIVQENDVLLSKSGIEHLNANRKMIFSSTPWRDVPDDMLGERIEANRPYLPKIPNIRRGVAFLK